jgi:zinc transporter ZupT
MVLLFASLAMCSTLAGGFLAISQRRRLHLLMGVGAGVLLGAVFFDLLPESLAIAGEQGVSVRVVLGIVLGGFLLFYLAERLLVMHACVEEDYHVHKHLGRMSAIGLIVHSTLDGAAIGAASLVNWRTGLLVALAVIIHDTSDGLNTILLVTRGEKPRRSDIVFLIPLTEHHGRCGYGLRHSLDGRRRMDHRQLILNEKMGRWLLIPTPQLPPRLFRKTSMCMLRAGLGPSLGQTP